MVDGGMVLLEVFDKAGPDVHCRCIDPGLIFSRANLTFKRDGELIRGQNANLSVVSAKVRVRILEVPADIKLMWFLYEGIQHTVQDELEIMSIRNKYNQMHCFQYLHFNAHFPRERCFCVPWCGSTLVNFF